MADDGSHRTAVITPDANTLQARLGALRDGLLTLLANWQTDPTLAVIERGFTAPLKGATAGPSATKLGMAQGVLIVALWDVATPVMLVSPSTAKKHATGKGNAAKPAVLDAAVSRLGFQPTASTLKRVQVQDYDRADALWLAHYGWQEQRKQQ